jgi:NTP pyrophosphatase (non-canonical NTP hydrolase)
MSKETTSETLDLPPIPTKATLSQWQTYVSQVVQARGWNKASDLEVFLLFSEEVGELAKAFRQHRQLFVESKNAASTNDTKQELASEMADVLSYLFDLAQRLDINLEQAAIDKELVNRSRHWE